MASLTAAPLEIEDGKRFVEDYYSMLGGGRIGVFQFYGPTTEFCRPVPYDFFCPTTTLKGDGKRFIQQYMRGKSRMILSQFYGDTSEFFRPLVADDPHSPSTPIKRAKKIESSDVQKTLSGGLCILVTGCMELEDNTLQDFSQAFVLEPQAGRLGFFVRNDILFYTDNAHHKLRSPASRASVPEEAPIWTKMSRKQQIGRGFVVQYYHTLKMSNDEAYAYYDDNSIVGRPEADGSFSTATTLEGIKSKLQDFGSLNVRIRSSDMQDSLSGGLLILVNGFKRSEDRTVQNIAQLFFLAPQPRGSFVVLNDMFCYMKAPKTVLPARKSEAQKVGHRTGGHDVLLEGTGDAGEFEGAMQQPPLSKLL